MRLPVDRSTPVSTRRPENFDLPADIGDLAIRVLGSADLAKEWLEKPALALDGRIPRDLLSSASGTQLVRELLLRIEYGVYP